MKKKTEYRTHHVHTEGIQERIHGPARKAKRKKTRNDILTGLVMFIASGWVGHWTARRFDHEYLAVELFYVMMNVLGALLIGVAAYCLVRVLVIWAEYAFSKMGP